LQFASYRKSTKLTGFVFIFCSNGFWLFFDYFFKTNDLFVIFTEDFESMNGSIKLFLQVIGCSFILHFFIVYSFSQTQDPNNQLLWKITGNGLKKPSYLFGSFHSNDSRLFDLSDSAFAALLNADAVVLEADMYSIFTDFDSRINQPKLQFDSKGNPYTNSSYSSKTRYGNEDGRPHFLDAYFQQIAYNANKQFYALETVQSQLDVFDEISLQSLKGFSFKSLPYNQEAILQSYLKGDIENMRMMLMNQFSASTNAYELLITKRNVNMVKGIDTLCRNKSLFIAIGAGHLAGTEGIIHLLRAKGYSVRQVIATYSKNTTSEELKLRVFNSYTHIDTIHGFRMTFGGKPVIDSTESHLKLVYQEMGQGNTYWLEVFDDFDDQSLEKLAEEHFFLPEKAQLKSVQTLDQFPALEGITYIYGVGNSWRRLILCNNRLYKLTCFGGNKFMNSDRPKRYFDRFLILSE
jgi:uncharacterized protein YbaP (TraB family)